MHLLCYASSCASNNRFGFLQWRVGFVLQDSTSALGWTCVRLSALGLTTAQAAVCRELQRSLGAVPAVPRKLELALFDATLGSCSHAAGVDQVRLQVTTEINAEPRLCIADNDSACIWVSTSVASQLCDIIDNILDVSVCLCGDSLAGNNSKENNLMKHTPSATLTHVSDAFSVCVTDNITNMSQVASVAMEYHLFYKGSVSLMMTTHRNKACPQPVKYSTGSSAGTACKVKCKECEEWSRNHKRARIWDIKGTMLWVKRSARQRARTESTALRPCLFWARMARRDQKGVGLPWVQSSGNYSLTWKRRQLIHSGKLSVLHKFLSLSLTSLISALCNMLNCDTARRSRRQSHIEVNLFEVKLEVWQRQASSHAHTFKQNTL